MHLGHVMQADGRWRLLVFASASDMGQAGGAVWQLCADLQDDPRSVLNLCTPKGTDIDTVIDIRAVFPQGHQMLEFDQMPALLRPQKGKYGLTDYEKIFCPDPKAGDIFDMRGVDNARGAMVLVRPDQYVAHVLPLNAASELRDFLSEFMVEQNT